MPRVGLRLGSHRRRAWSVRASYGLFYDQFQNGSGTASQVAISAMPRGAVQPVQRRRAQLPEPVSRAPVRAPDTFVRPSTVFAHGRRREAAVRAALEPERAAVAVRAATRRGALRRRRRHAPAAQRRGQSGGLGPGATAQNADRRRIYANCPADGGTCDFSTIAMLRNITSVELPRRAGEPVAPLRRRPRLQRVVLVFANPSITCRR